MRSLVILIFGSYLLLYCNLVNSQTSFTEVISSTKIASGLNGFGQLDNEDFFATGITTLGDLDNNGYDDVAVGVQFDDDGGTNSGAIYILFLDASDSIISYQKISATQGNMKSPIGSGANFGHSVAQISDLDNDGIKELAVGAYLSDHGGVDKGVLYILFLDNKGLVKKSKMIGHNLGGLGAILKNGDRFGRSLANLGDYDQDGIDEIAVGAHLDDDGGVDQGALYVLFINSNGSVKKYQKISETAGNFSGILDKNDYFASSIANIGDLDNDGINDIAVGANKDDDGGSNKGAVWILFMNNSGKVKSNTKISSNNSLFKNLFNVEHRFGSSLEGVGDLNGDGVNDLIVGADFDDDGGQNRGAFWILYLNRFGGVYCHDKVSSSYGNFQSKLSNGDRFGHAIALLEEPDKNGKIKIGVGVPNDKTGGTNRGAMYIISLEPKNKRIITPSLEICERNLLTLQSEKGPIVGWANSNGKPVSFKANFSLTLSSTDTIFYWMSRSNPKGCAILDTLILRINPLPKPSLGADTAISINDTLVLTPGIFTMYEWQGTMGTSVFEFDASLMGIGTHEVEVAVIDENGCRNTDSIEIEVAKTTSLGLVDASAITIFPNPVSETLFIEDSNGYVKYLVNSVDGKQMLSGIFTNSISVSNLSKGVYSLVLFDRNGNFNQTKFIVE